MVKKTLLSMAIAAAVVSLAGCNVSSTDKYDNKIIDNAPGSAELQDVGNLYPIFAPERGELPLATDLVFAKAGDTDGTADTEDTQPPVTTALNKLAGFSTIAPIYINFEGEPAGDSVKAGQTVFLIKMRAGGNIDALDLTSIVTESTKAGKSPVADPASQPVPVEDYVADVVKLGDTSAVRILLKKPLDPKTKYIVALTNGITDGTNYATGSSTYQITSSNNVLPSKALAPVRAAVQGWEEIAGGFLQEASSGALTKDNIILSYAFTTDGSLDDIQQYAAPGLFVKNNLTVAQAEAMTDAKAAPLTDIVARSMAVAMGGGDPTNPALLAGVDPATITAIKGNPAYPVQLFNAIATADLGGATLAAAAAAPAPRDVELVRPAAVDAALAQKNISTGASPATLLTMAGGSSTDLTTRYIQGSIQLPDFLGTATKTDMGLAAQNPQAAVAQAWRADRNWEANTNVGTILNGALEKPDAFPPKDVDGVSTNVTYRYPFPQQIGTNTAPFLLTLPSKADCSGKPGMNANGEFQTVIFVHGITSNRTASAVYAAQLAAQCIATIAIDLPLHGVAPADGLMTMLSMSTADAAATSSPWAAVSAGAMATMGVTPIAQVSERHGNIWQNDNSMRVDMNYDVIAEASTITDEDEKAKKYASGGNSGSAFINLQNFGRTHDNLRQAVTDLLNLNASLVKINEALAADTELTGASANRGTLDLNNVFVAGHSLGGIVASAFVAANNDPEVQAFVGYNPNGGGAGVATGVLPKVQGLIIANSGAHITKLLENSPAFAPQIVGGLAQSGISQGSESFEKFLYVFQSKIDGIDPANTASKFGNTPVSMFTVDGIGSGMSMTGAPDNTVPVFDYFADETTNPFAAAVDLVNGPIKLPSAGVPTAKAPLAGTQGIKAVASGVTEHTYDEGTHSTFANADTPATFVDMVTQSINFILSN